jgi:hypothetical protein
MVGSLAQFFEFLERWLRAKTSSMIFGNHWPKSEIVNLIATKKYWNCKQTGD